MTTLEEETEVIRNAARLLSDARLLAQHSRWGSAHALAVLALEEVGKVILGRWNSVREPKRGQSRHSFHVRKQAAVAHLLMARVAIEKVMRMGGSDRPFSDPERADLARTMWESEAGRFAFHAEIGVVERTKQVGLYRDIEMAQLGLEADGFTEADVSPIFDQISSAVDLIFDDQAMRVARRTYDLQFATG